MLCTHKFLLYNAPCRLLTPPQSSDMKIIENLLSLLEVEVYKKNISNRNDLKETLQAAWSEICPQMTANLVDSMPYIYK